MSVYDIACIIDIGTSDQHDRLSRPLGGVSLPRRRLSPRMESTIHVTAMCLDHVLVKYYARATLSTINYEVDSSETSGISR